MANTFDSTRAYLVGRKVLLERNKEKLEGLKDAFELDCIGLMERLDVLMKEGLDKYTSEISKLSVSIDLHQGMLVSLDTEVEVEDIASIDLDARRELSNLDSIIALTDNRIKALFTTKSTAPHIVKRTVKEPQAKDMARAGIETKAIVAPPGYVDPKVRESIEDRLFKAPFQYNPYPEDYYIKPNGYVNNRFVGDMMYDYMKNYKSEMSIKEMVDWVREMFPRAVHRWATIEKGVANVIHLHLKKNDLVEQVAYGTYRAKEK